MAGTNVFVMDPDNLNKMIEGINSLKSGIDKLAVTMKDAKGISEDLNKTSENTAGATGSGGKVAEMTAGDHAQLNYVKNMMITDFLGGLTNAVTNAVGTLMSLAQRAATYESSLINMSYRMTNPTGQMDYLYTRGGLEGITRQLNQDATGPWQKIQLDQMVNITEKFLQYGKYNSQDQAFDQNLLTMGRIGGESFQRRGLEYNAGTETAMKYNVAGVKMGELQQFTEHLGDVAKIGSMTSREILSIDSAIRKLSMSFGYGNKQIQQFGLEYMKTAGIISLVGGDPTNIMGKMNQWVSGSETGMLNSLLLGYNPSDPGGNLQKTSQAAAQAQSLLASTPETMRPYMFNMMSPSLGLGGYDYTDLEPLARTGKGKAKNTAELTLKEISEHGKTYIGQADKLAAILSQVNMDILNVGKGQLKGIVELTQKWATPMLSMLKTITDYAAENPKTTAAVLSVFNSLGTIGNAFFAYAAYKGVTSVAGLAMPAAAGAAGAGGVATAAGGLAAAGGAAIASTVLVGAGLGVAAGMYIDSKWTGENKKKFFDFISGKGISDEQDEYREKFLLGTQKLEGRTFESVMREGRNRRAGLGPSEVDKMSVEDLQSKATKEFGSPLFGLDLDKYRQYLELKTEGLIPDYKDIDSNYDNLHKRNEMEDFFKQKGFKITVHEEGEHAPNSLHKKMAALDFSIKGIAVSKLIKDLTEGSKSGFRNFVEATEDDAAANLTPSDRKLLADSGLLKIVSGGNGYKGIHGHTELTNLVSGLNTGPRKSQAEAEQTGDLKSYVDNIFFSNQQLQAPVVDAKGIVHPGGIATSSGVGRAGGAAVSSTNAGGAYAAAAERPEVTYVKDQDLTDLVDKIFNIMLSKKDKLSGPIPSRHEDLSGQRTAGGGTIWEGNN